MAHGNENRQMDGNQELKWVPNPTANVGQCRNQETQLAEWEALESVASSVGAWSEAPAVIDIGVISTAKSRHQGGNIIFVKSEKYFVLKFHCAYCQGQEWLGGPDRGPIESPPLSPISLISLPLEVYVPVNPARGLGECCEIRSNCRKLHKIKVILFAAVGIENHGVNVINKKYVWLLL